MGGLAGRRVNGANLTNRTMFKQKIEKLEAAVAEKDVKVGELAAAIEAKDAEIQNAQAELEVAANEIDNLKSQLEAKGADLEAKEDEFVEAVAKRAAEMVADASGEKPLADGKPVVAEVSADEKVLREYEAIPLGKEKVAFQDRNHVEINRAKEAREAGAKG